MKIDGDGTITTSANQVGLIEAVAEPKPGPSEKQDPARSE